MHRTICRGSLAQNIAEMIIHHGDLVTLIKAGKELRSAIVGIAESTLANQNIADLTSH